LAVLSAILRASSRAGAFVFSFDQRTGRKIGICVSMSREHADHICLSCGKAMRLARTIPGIGEPPALRTYECKACGVVFTESAGRAEVARELSPLVFAISLAISVGL
jgi:ribosomal protein L37AE/L43A